MQPTAHGVVVYFCISATKRSCRLYHGTTEARVAGFPSIDTNPKPFLRFRLLNMPSIKYWAVTTVLTIFATSELTTALNASPTAPSPAAQPTVCTADQAASCGSNCECNIAISDGTVVCNPGPMDYTCGYGQVPGCELDSDCIEDIFDSSARCVYSGSYTYYGSLCTGGVVCVTQECAMNKKARRSRSRAERMMDRVFR